MSRRVWLTLVVMLSGGCKIVSQQELADLKNPPNPKMANIDQLWQQKLVPQVQAEAKPLATLMSSLQSAKDFDSACQTYGYRSQAENPCVFSVSVRCGKMAVKDESGDSVTIQVGPIIRGTALRDVYKGASYQDFNDQVLFGDYGKAINQHASTLMQQFAPKVGDKVSVTGVFSSWDIPQQLPDITPAAITRQ